VRDQVDALVQSGQSEQEAFETAMRAMGAGPVTEDAYRRVFWGKMRRKGLMKRSLSAELVMLRNHLTLALRNLRRRPGYTFINITGLSIGIGACLLILLFVRDEMSFDRFHENADRIVRVILRSESEGRETEVTPTIVAPLFKRTFAQVEEATRVYDIARYHTVAIRRGENAWQEDGSIYADSTFFDVFSFPFLVGTPEGALSRPNTLLLTESSARRYFGDASLAMGQTLDVGTAGEFEVTGVLADVPANSHLRFDVVGSFVSTSWASGEIWGSANFYTYLLLTDAAALTPLEVGVADAIAEARLSGAVPTDFGLGLQRLTDIYMVHMGRQKYVWMFASLALLILFMACVNYINLSTARSARRAREVGVRKALGAQRAQIVWQFFSESALLTGMALLLGLVLVFMLLPAFNDATGKAIQLDMLGEPAMWLMFGGLMILTTVGSGIYPSLLLSRFNPAIVLKGSKGSRSGGASLRRVLVVFQFAVTVFLIVATFVVFKQLQFIRSSDVGFDRNQVVVVQLADADDRRAVPIIQAALPTYPEFLDAAAMNAIPGNQLGGYGLSTEADLESRDHPNISATPVSANVVNTLGLRLVAGTGFVERGDPLVSPDSAQYQYVVNEDLVRLAGWTPETAVGQRMSVSGGRRMGEVVGVIENYNFLSLREQMKPLALFVEPGWHVLLIKLREGDTPAALARLKDLWAQASGGSPFQYSFLDDDFNAFYQSEERLASVFAGAAQLAILIACLGLFGLAAFTAEERTREIGIRKSLGATTPGLVGMLNREFALLVLAGFAVAAPLGWWATSEWLSSYAFRTPVGIWVFVAAGVGAFLVAGGAVSLQSVRAARKDPVAALRHD
jgi:putative ABC transport system permease protein